MFCTKCGYNLGDANFCPQCGNPAKKPTVAPVSQPVVTPVVAPEVVVAPIIEPVVEVVAEPIAPEVVVAPIIEPVVETIAEPVVEPVVETVAESVVEPVVETVAESVVEPVVETVAEPIIEQQIVEAVAEPEPVVETVAESVVEPVVESVAESVAEPVVEPVVESVAEPVAEPVVTPVMQQVSVQPVQTQQVEVQETPVEPAVQPVTPQPAVQPVAPQPAVQPATPAQNPNLTWNNDAQQMWNTYQPTSKKKSKAPIIIGVVAALVIALVCVGIFLVMPMLKEKKQQEEIAKVNLAGTTALKSVTAEIKASASSIANNFIVVKSGSKQKVTSSFTLNKVVLDDEDVMSYYNVDTVNYTVESDAETGKINVKIALSKGSSTPVINMHIYTDGSTAYIRIPELFSGSLKTSVETDDEDADADETDKTKQIADILANMDEETMKQYAKVFEALVGHIVTGLDTVIDKAQYTKNEGTVSISAGELGSNSYESYNVVVNKSDVIAAYNSTINAIFDDASIVPYITMLSTVGTRIDKETLKTEFSDSLKNSPATFKMTLYTKDSKFAGVGLNAKDYDDKEEGTITVVTVGNNSLYVDMVDGKDYLNVCLDGRNDNKKLTVNGDIEDSYMTMNCEWKMNGNSYEVTKFELVSKDTKENTGISVSLTGKTSTEQISEVTFKTSDFPNVIDTETATEQQAMAYLNEVAQNWGNIMTKIFSDKYMQGSGMMGTLPDQSGAVDGTAGSL